MVSTFSHLDPLLQDLLLMLTDANDYDVIFQVGENQIIKECHANILKARSTYFKDALSTAELVNIKDNKIELKEPKISPIVFDIILKYIYTGEVDLTDSSDVDILELIVASDKMLLEELFEFAQDYLIISRSTWVQQNLQNLVLVLHTVFPITNCKKLQDYCVKSISDSQLFFNLENFLSLDESILYELLKRDDLLIEEINIWDYLIKWGIEQTTSLGSENNDKTKWNNENFEALKETLSQFIPLIRFSEISSADFFDKVRPYKAVIPTNIYEEAMEFHMKGTLTADTTILSPRIGTIPIESRIIKPELAYIIANWIDKKDAKAVRNKNNLRYKFNLLYRSSRDCLHFNAFRDKCENQGPCVILIKQRQTSNGIDPDDIWDSQPTWETDLNDDLWDVPAKTSRDIDLIGGWGVAPQYTSWNTDSIESDTSQQTSWDNLAEFQLKPAKNSTKIYGEYYSHKFTYNEWYSSTNNFIFSFANDHDIKNMKICRMNYDDVTTPYDDNVFSLGSTFRIVDTNTIYVKNSYYNDTNVISSGVTMLFPKEIEVFKITKEQ
ncbi:hypothetical protein C1645_740945 [Glomus cerebriforme]|uniref:BTB domain-containing protein n=1 Tax=Glomus cerebriforme TaxID=658196 RepID=A0A397SJJ1_9GLOM|nr:hypothetical protein C1645_740945 [Glomus cerebriforme]